MLALAIDIITDPDSFTKTKRLETAKSLRELKRSIEFSTELLCKEVKVLDPVPSLDYVHSRQKQNVLQDITNKRQLTGHTHSSKKAKTSPPFLPAPKLTAGLPAPQNGKQYSKLEVVEVLNNAASKASSSELLTKILESKLVPVGRRQVNRLLARYKKDDTSLKDQ